MAPFKLKFRMGGSRSTSQEHDPDPQVNEALLNHHQQQQHGTSTSTLDSADGNSLASLGVNSERRSLLPNVANANKSNNFRLGYLNQSSGNEADSSTLESANVPTTPPPSYEHVLEELQNTHISSQYEQSPQRQISNSSAHGSVENLQRQSRRSSVNSVQPNPMEQIYEIETCNDPNCEENIAYNERQRLQREQETNFNCGVENNNRSHIVDYGIGNATEIRKSSVDSNEYIFTRNMTAPVSEENLLSDCTGNCQQYDVDDYENGACGGRSNAGGMNRNSVNSSNSNGDNDFSDPLMNHGNYYNNAPSHNQHGNSSGTQNDGYNHVREQQQQQHQQQQHQQQQQQIQQQQQHQQQQQNMRCLTPEFISNKSSKEIYKNLAKKWGITCKMSDGCRCIDCQSNYFDCEFDDNEHQKSDGGLGAGTPMFISEVMHGSACHIL